MKTAGIVTFHCADNYGAVLQAYALYRKLIEYNIEPEFIDFRPNRIINPYIHSLSIRDNLGKYGFKNGIRRQLSNTINYKKNRRAKNNFDNFRTTYLKMSHLTYSYPEELKNADLKYDYYITGSDQVWNPDMITGLEDIYFLGFADRTSKRISYAASIAKELDKNKYDIFSNYLSDIDYISIREKSHKELIERLAGKNVEVIADPTFLFEKCFWENSLALTAEKNKQVLVYDLIKDPLTVSVANFIANSKKLDILSYSGKKGFVNWKKSFSGDSPVKLLQLISSAEYVVSSSFHGMVFSIIFNKPFYVIAHPTRGSRMRDLLKELDLESRLIANMSEINLEEEIDYKLVNVKISKLRGSAESFLKKSLDLGDFE